MSSALRPISTRSPLPRKRELWYEEFRYSLGATVELRAPRWRSTASIGRAIASRQTAIPTAPPSSQELATVLWACARVFRTEILPSGSLWQHRAAPSAGGRHPIDLVVLTRKRACFLYDGICHSLHAICETDKGATDRMVRQCSDAIGFIKGVMVMFVAQSSRTTSKYRDGESLVWRDSGCLLAHAYLACSALGLKCVGLGPTGDPHIARMLRGQGQLSGVGGCVIGR
jgi:SagB-type dehydrogenase family enzyme